MQKQDLKKQDPTIRSKDRDPKLKIRQKRPNNKNIQKTKIQN